MFNNLAPVFEKAGPAVEQIFSHTGLNAYWNYTFVRDPIKEGINTVSGLANDLEEHSPNIYSNLGSGIGMTATSFGTSAIMGYGVYAGMRNQRIKENAVQAYISKEGIFSAENGTMTSYRHGISGYAKSVSEYTGEEYIAKKMAISKKRWINLETGKMYKPSMGMGKNLAITAGIIAAGVVGTMALSTAGKWVDQASSLDIDRRRQHYDNREFYGTGRYLQSMNDTYNKSMDALESKMFSCARAYHHRG